MSEYVPHEDDVRAAWVGRLGTDTPLFTDEADAEFDRFLAKVKRTAARGALDGLADEANHIDWQMDGPSFALRVRRFKNRNHPEVTP